jgi:hypothetical protein
MHPSVIKSGLTPEEIEKIAGPMKLTHADLGKLICRNRRQSFLSKRGNAAIVRYIVFAANKQSSNLRD